MSRADLSIDTSLISTEQNLMRKDEVDTPETKSSPFKGEEDPLTFKKNSGDVSVENLNSNLFAESPLFSFGRRFQNLSKDQKLAKKISFDPRIITGTLKPVEKAAPDSPAIVLFETFSSKITTQMVCYCLQRLFNYDFEGLVIPPLQQTESETLPTNNSKIAI